MVTLFPIYYISQLKHLEINAKAREAPIIHKAKTIESLGIKKRDELKSLCNPYYVTSVYYFTVVYILPWVPEVFFFECVGMLRFVGSRPTRVRPKADDRNPETAHEKPLDRYIDRYIFRIFMFFPNKLACGGQTYFRSSLLFLNYFSEGEKRRPEIRLRFAGY